MQGADKSVRQQHEREGFLQLADKLANATDTAEQKRLKQDLTRLTFGE